MYQKTKKNILNLSVFIPIRKGSKRIKNKNLKSLPGLAKGLTELKIIQLKKLKKIFKNKFKSNLDVIITSDCQKVKLFLKKFKWIKIFDRPKNTASDDSLKKLIKYVPKICKTDYILWTHVTSPLFNERDYFNFIKKFISAKKKDKSLKSAFSADEIQKFILSKNGDWISHNYKRKNWPRTQDLSPLYIVNSAVFLCERKIYLTEKDRLSKKPLPIKSRINSGFDVDNMEDFKILKNEKYIRKFSKS